MFVCFELLNVLFVSETGITSGDPFLNPIVITVDSHFSFEIPMHRGECQLSVFVLVPHATCVLYMNTKVLKNRIEYSEPFWKCF